ncbi:hypothetical protein GOV04_04445 [Candidatus Woesearchaeota archaeon]|nr:hypothetical protein [Candidatus Woesearchaeota archaeon]
MAVDRLDFDEILKIQRMTQIRLAQELKEDRTANVIVLLNQLTKNGQKAIQTEEFLVESEAMGMTEKDATEILDKLIVDKIVLVPKEGYLELF